MALERALRPTDSTPAPRGSAPGTMLVLGAPALLQRNEIETYGTFDTDVIGVEGLWGLTASEELGNTSVGSGRSVRIRIGSHIPTDEGRPAQRVLTRILGRWEV